MREMEGDYFCVCCFLCHLFILCLRKKPKTPGMDRWEGRVAVVTGASSGIGNSVAKALVMLGMKVVGCAKTIEPIEVCQVFY